MPSAPTRGLNAPIKSCVPPESTFVAGYPRRAINSPSQEMHIARLAAEGLTNREIGKRLFLSHRTVGSHLYRIFPEAGSRLALGVGPRRPGRPCTTSLHVRAVK